MLSFQCSICGRNALRKFTCSNCGDESYNELEHDIFFKEEDGTAILSDTGTCPSYLNCPDCGGRIFAPASLNLCISCFKNLPDSKEK